MKNNRKIILFTLVLISILATILSGCSSSGKNNSATETLSLLCKILGVDSHPFGHGYTFRGNFYKCGDETAIPHYGMWNPVGTENADFHRPEYFGDFVIE